MGQYLRPSIDVDNSMTYKILFPDGNCVCCSTVRTWTPVEEANPVFLADCENMSQVQEALGAACTVGDFEDADLTPEFEYYADDVEDGFEGTPDEILPPMTEVNDNYVVANFLLPPGNNMVQGRVRKRSRHNDGNPIGRANEIPILNREEYFIEFKDGTEAELSANTIAQSIYAHCEPDGHIYVLFDYLTDLRQITWCFVMQTRQCRRNMDVYSCSDPLLYGNSVSYGRTDLPLGKSCWTSRSCIHLRLLSMLCLKVLNVNLHLTVGFHLS